MALFSREVYNRQKILDRAAELARKRRYRAAVEEYRKVLENEHDNYEIHARMAPLLVKLGDEEEAWESFNRAANGFLVKGFMPKAIGVFSSAASLMPGRIEVWEMWADLKLNQKQPGDAFQILIKGRRHFRGRKRRASAIQLLEKALKIQPSSVFATIDVAGLLRKEKRPADALNHLRRLERTEGGRNLRKLRWQILVTEPSPGALWRWIKAAVLGR